LKYLGALTIAAALFFGAPAQADDTAIWTGNYLLNACQQVTNVASSSKTPLYFQQGICLGVVAGLMDVGRYLKPDLAFCPPQGANYVQATRIVVKYMEENPRDLHEHLTVLISFVLRKTWPCE
jgi:hypothetical protein